MMNWVSASSMREAWASISGSPANCPALVTLVMEISTACCQVRPSLTAFMPKVKDTER